MWLKKWLIRYQVWQGEAIDIWSRAAFPADVLSNLCSNGFRFDGRVCGSMEGLLQSLKQSDPDKQRKICGMKGRKARSYATTGWQTDQKLYWKDKVMDRRGEEYQVFLRKAYTAMFCQNERFRMALMATRRLKLYHTRGNDNPYKTIITPDELCTILVEIRDAYDTGKLVLPEPAKESSVSMERLLIHLQVGNQELSLQITRYQEESYRRAVHALNEAYSQLAKSYPSASPEQLMAMLALQQTLKRTGNEE